MFTRPLYFGLLSLMLVVCSLYSHAFSVTQMDEKQKVGESEILVVAIINGFETSVASREVDGVEVTIDVDVKVAKAELLELAFGHVNGKDLSIVVENGISELDLSLDAGESYVFFLKACMEDTYCVVNSRYGYHLIDDGFITINDAGVDVQEFLKRLKKVKCNQDKHHCEKRGQAEPSQFNGH